MNDISELESRIAAALDRAGRALDQISAVSTEPVESSDAAALKEELDAERVANAQLEERVRAIKEKQETTLAALEAEVSRLRQSVTEKDGSVQRMRAVNSELRQSNQAMRDAISQGLADPHLVNRSMMSELESLRATRDADRAELDDILAALEPVLKEA